MLPAAPAGETLSRDFLDALIQAALRAVLAIFRFGIFPPFPDPIVWSLFLAVSLYPLQVRRTSRYVQRASCLWLLPGPALQSQPSKRMPMRRG